MRMNTVQTVSLPSDADMKRPGRGTVAVQRSRIGGVHSNLIKWMDSKSVTLLTTSSGSVPMTQVKGFDRKAHEMVEFKRSFAKGYCLRSPFDP